MEKQKSSLSLFLSLLCARFLSLPSPSLFPYLYLHLLFSFALSLLNRLNLSIFVSRTDSLFLSIPSRIYFPSLPTPELRSTSPRPLCLIPNSPNPFLIYLLPRPSFSSPHSLTLCSHSHLHSHSYLSLSLSLHLHPLVCLLTNRSFYSITSETEIRYPFSIIMVFFDKIFTLISLMLHLSGHLI